jgi:hypothetical protein
VVAAVVVVVAVVSVVVGLGGASLNRPTVSVTVAPGFSCVSAAGSCEMTIPSRFGSVVSSCFTFTLKPDATSWLLAVSTSLFSTFGTPVVCGPLDTVSVTVAPFEEKLPPDGSWSITIPAAAAFESTSVRATANPSACNCDAAES